MSILKRKYRWVGSVLLGIAWTASAQAPKAASGPTPAPAAADGNHATATANAQQTAQFFEFGDMARKLRALQTERGTTGTISTEESLLRLQLLEAIEDASLHIDGVLGEISNERNELGDLRTSLQGRRDKTVGHLTTAALLTGSGLGTVVSATQFSSLSNTTQNVGNSIGIGSGVVSTLFSIMAARKQKGPSGTVQQTPNMLAPLLGNKPVLNTYFPPAVLQYLQSIPAGEDRQRGTRLDQLKQRWVTAGRLGAEGDAKAQQKLDAATASNNADVHVNIEDLTNRIAMLGDVQGSVALMKRNLAVFSAYARGASVPDSNTEK